jgi:hypothetical protein
MPSCREAKWRRRRRPAALRDIWVVEWAWQNAAPLVSTENT